MSITLGAAHQLFFATMIHYTVDQHGTSSISVWLVADLGEIRCETLIYRMESSQNISCGTSGCGPVVVSGANLL